MVPSLDSQVLAIPVTTPRTAVTALHWRVHASFHARHFYSSWRNCPCQTTNRWIYLHCVLQFPCNILTRFADFMLPLSIVAMVIGIYLFFNHTCPQLVHLSRSTSGSGPNQGMLNNGCKILCSSASWTRLAVNPNRSQELLRDGKLES